MILVTSKIPGIGEDRLFDGGIDAEVYLFAETKFLEGLALRGPGGVSRWRDRYLLFEALNMATESTAIAQARVITLENHLADARIAHRSQIIIQERIQTALGNGSDENAWQPGETWASATCRIIEWYRDYHNGLVP